METIEDSAKKCAGKCIEWCSERNHKDENGVTHAIARTLHEQHEADVKKACVVLDKILSKDEIACFKKAMEE